MIPDKYFIIVSVIIGLTLSGLIVYNFIGVNNNDNIIEATQISHCPICLDPPNCPVPEVINYPYPVEVIKTVTSTVEVSDEQCEKAFANYKQKYRNVIYDWNLNH